MGQSLRRFHAVHIPVFPRKSFKRKGQIIKDLDLDELQLDTFCHKPKSIEDLMKNTKFSKRELKIMYRGFKQECPNGLMDLNKFIQIYKSFFPVGNAEPYACHIHRTMLKRSDGPITFDRLISELSLLTYGTTKEKLEWVFDLYDVQKNGFISRKDFLEVVHAIYQLLGDKTSPVITKSSINDHANAIFEKLDLNGDEEISIDEFKSAYLNDPQFVMNIQALSTHF